MGADVGDYDIFQKFPDGSSLWQLCVTGRYNAKRKLQELAEISRNEFYAVDIASGEILSTSDRQLRRVSAKKVGAPKVSAPKADAA